VWSRWFEVAVMADITYFVVSQREGTVGAIAFSRSGDLSSETFDDAQVLRKFGDAPDNLSAL
jgi:hypothetical protein